MDGIKPKQYNFYGVQGFSENQLTQHAKLYDGYVSKLNEVRGILEVEQHFEDSNSTFSRMRSLKLAESYALNGVKLHQMYFDNIRGIKTQAHASFPIQNAIVKRFGTQERFLSRWMNVGLAMRGWVVLVWDHLDRELHIIGQDAHDNGSTIGTVPLLVMDVYEHAYMIDFGINRRAYIEIFIQNINWSVVQSRFMEL